MPMAKVLGVHVNLSNICGDMIGYNSHLMDEEIYNILMLVF